MFPIHFMCEARRESISRIGAYLFVFAGQDYHWERRIQRLDTKTWRYGKANNKFLRRDWMHFQYYIIAICCSLAAIYKVLLSNFSNNEILIRIVAIVVLSILSLFVLKITIVFIPDTRTEYIKQWESIKREEKRKKPVC